MSEVVKVKCKKCGEVNRVYMNIQGPIKDYGLCQKCSGDL